VVRAYHAIFCTYGFWLPNDPRGSWSDFVRSWELLKYGKATKTSTRASVASRRHDRAAREAAKTALQRPPVTFDGHQALTVAEGFARAVQQGGYILHACSIMPDHVHFVSRRDGRKIESVIAHLKRASTRQLRERGRHPFLKSPKRDGTLPSPWARGHWKIFLNNEASIARALEYVETNPLRAGLKRQNWSFVVPYEA